VIEVTNILTLTDSFVADELPQSLTMIAKGGRGMTTEKDSTEEGVIQEEVSTNCHTVMRSQAEAGDAGLTVILKVQAVGEILRDQEGKGHRHLHVSNPRSPLVTAITGLGLRQHQLLRRRKRILQSIQEVKKARLRKNSVHVIRLRGTLRDLYVRIEATHHNPLWHDDFGRQLEITYSPVWKIDMAF